MFCDVNMLKVYVFCAVLICSRFKLSFGEDICVQCDCKANVIDCSNKDKSSVPDLKNANKSILLFEHNKILHLRQFPALKVNYLSFAYNYITTIDDSAFKNLYNLTSLDLSSNLLSSVSLLPNVFKGNYQPDLYEPLRQLKDLNLANNIFHTLHPHVFEHLPNLEKLILSGNPLKVINQGMVNAFSSLPFLKELNLSNTSIKTLPSDVFHAPKYLEILDLSYNLFTKPPIELDSTHSLRWLSLDGNPIKYIDDFVHLPFLHVLHLSNMPELMAIRNRSLSGLPLLEEFYCTDNRILTKISKDTFSAIHINEDEEGEIWPPLKVLDLNNNALRYIESHLVGHWENLKMINLQHNPWMCDCENQWLVSTLTPMMENFQPDMLNSLKCYGPKDKKNLPIVTLSKQTSLCKNNEPWIKTTAQFYLGVAILLLAVIPALIVTCIYYKNTMNYRNEYLLQYEMYDYSRFRGSQSSQIECHNIQF